MGTSAVVDGHRGFEAARAALFSVVTASDPINRFTPVKWVGEMFEIAAGAVADVIAKAETKRQNSRTALTIALIRDHQLAVATLGDSAAVVVRGEKALSLGQNSQFLGGDTDVSHVQVETLQLCPDDLVILCTDGLTRFLGGNWPNRLAEISRDQREPENMVRAAVEAAFTGGAGDNIAVAALRV